EGSTQTETSIEETRVSVAIKLPDQYRIERLDAVGTNENQPKLLVANTDRWWTKNSEGVTETGLVSSGRGSRRVPHLTIAERHFVRSQLREFFMSLDLTQLATLEHAGRHCVQIRAVLRRGARLWPHWLPCGADEFRLYGDIERGTLLSIEGVFQGEVF